MESQDRPSKEADQKQPETSTADRVKELETAATDLTEKWKRAAADYANLEKRFAREKMGLAEWSNARLLLKILPILDDLEKAVSTHPNEGLELILRKFREVLRTEGIQEIATVDTPFDPHLHECLEVEEGPEGKIVALLRRGYKIGKQVLRPAQVRVAKAKPTEEKL